MHLYLVSEKRFDKATGEQTSNLYTVYRSQGVIYDLPSVKSDPSPSSSETHKLESSNHSHSLEENFEDRKVLWNALVDAIGYQPSTQVERAGWNKCIKQLREAGAKADEIPSRVSQYKICINTEYNIIRNFDKSLSGWSFLNFPVKI